MVPADPRGPNCGAVNGHQPRSLNVADLPRMQRLRERGNPRLPVRCLRQHRNRLCPHSWQCRADRYLQRYVRRQRTGCGAGSGPEGSARKPNLPEGPARARSPPAERAGGGGNPKRVFGRRTNARADAGRPAVTDRNDLFVRSTEIQPGPGLTLRAWVSSCAPKTRSRRRTDPRSALVGIRQLQVPEPRRCDAADQVPDHYADAQEPAELHQQEPDATQQRAFALHLRGRAGLSV